MKNTIPFFMIFVIFLMFCTGPVYTQTGWQWQNPLPQGNDMFSVCYPDTGTDFAVGAGGVIVCSSDGGNTWAIQPSGTTNDLHAVSFTDASTGTVAGIYGTILRTTTGGIVWVKENPDAAFKYNGEISLEQNYPNPVLETTTVNYTLKKDGFVSLTVYDIYGKEAAVLYDGLLNAGSYSLVFDEKDLPAGIYIYQLTSGESSAYRKMMVIK